MSINFGQFPTPNLPIQSADIVVGYQLIGSVPTLAQYSMLQLAGVVSPLLGVIPVSQGGTGLSALPAGDLLVGTGTNTMNFIIPGGAGQMLISQGTSVSPQFANNPTITGGSINNTPIGNTTPSTGVFSTVVAGSVFTNGGATPAVTTTGTQIYNSSNAPTIQLIDSIRSANNKNAFIQWGLTVLSLGFANDAFSAFVNAITITGGQAIGISGITSNSGTGAWAHTGAMSVTGTFTPAQVAGIVGTTTNNNAQAGSVGEFVTNVTTGTAMATATPVAATSVSLTAGDWDISGQVNFVPAGTTTVSVLTWGVNNSLTVTTGANGLFSQLVLTFPVGQPQLVQTGTVRMSLAGTTTVNLVAQATFGVSTMTCNGFIRARRVR